jgi:hypothetical protein
MYMRPDHRPVDCRHNQHGKRAAFKPLLVLHVLVASEKYVKAFALDQVEQQAVFDTTPLHADDGVNIMLGQGPRQLARYVLIENTFKAAPEIDVRRDSSEWL